MGSAYSNRIEDQQVMRRSIPFSENSNGDPGAEGNQSLILQMNQINRQDLNVDMVPNLP